MSRSKPETEQRRKKAARQPREPSTETSAATGVEKRIDAAHLVSDAKTPPPANASAGQPESRQVEAERVRIQAEQLAQHLDARQKDLDHREARLNAQLAQLDRDTRTARLWLTERQSELQRRSEELATAEEDVRKRSGPLAAADAAQDNQADPAAAQEDARRKLEADRRQIEDALCYEKQQIDARREASLQLVRKLLAALEQRREAIEAEAAKFEQQKSKARPELQAREDVSRRSAQELEARPRQLEQAEARLADSQAETQKLQQELREERRKVQEEGRIRRERLAAEHGRALEALEQKRQAVQRRAEHVDQCRLALQQLRGELGRMHRETLEIRLATEELWVQLSGAAPPAALTRSLGGIRSKLADHYRMANAELQAQKTELEGIRRQLAEHFGRLARQKRQFDQWAAAGHEEAEQHAARLIAREQQLRAREIELQDTLHRWKAERLEYRHEIRRLQNSAQAPPTRSVLTDAQGRTEATLPA